MLDTNICIFTIKNKPDIVRQAFNQHNGQMNNTHEFMRIPGLRLQDWTTH
ncbi:Hypothetical protein ABZS17G119_00054 [Kosakonia cowanii]